MRIAETNEAEETTRYLRTVIATMATAYSREDVMKAVDGARTNALEEATNSVCARISAWLMARSVSRRSDNEEQADALEEAALDVRDGEWRRPTEAPPVAECVPCKNGWAHDIKKCPNVKKPEASK